MRDDHVHASTLNLRRLAGGKLGAADAESLRGQIDGCVTCQRRAGAVAMLTPAAIACGIGLVATVLVVLAAIGWCTGAGPIGQWSIVRAPEAGGGAAGELLVAAAGGDRLSQAEALAVVSVAILTELEMGPRPVATGFIADRRVAIMTACEAIQAGNARRAVWALEMFADHYDDVGTPLRALALYVAGGDDGTDALLLDALADTENVQGMDRALDRAAVWFAGRTLVQRGESGAARELWGRLQLGAASDTFSRLAELAIRGLGSE